MPTTGAALQASTTALVRGDHAAGEADVRAVFDAVGTTRVLQNEAALHTATALAGSGPAFFLLALEAMGEAGVLLGMARDDAHFFAAGAMRAAAALALEDGAAPAALRARITSPGGTTVAGLVAMEQAGARRAFLDAVTTAHARSVQMGKRDN